jgi:hypothetical protein
MACLPKAPVAGEFFIVGGKFWPGDPAAELPALGSAPKSR